LPVGAGILPYAFESVRINFEGKKKKAKTKNEQNPAHKIIVFGLCSGTKVKVLLNKTVLSFYFFQGILF
jgi:hypothetical protein